MAEYPPYVNGYGSIPKLFNAIKTAAVPPKFTADFLHTVLGLKSSSNRALIPLLKRLGFIDQANIPTQAYKDFREDSLSGGIMADRLKDAYNSLFQANEYAWKLEKPALTEKLKSITGAAEDDQYLPSVVATFLTLSKLANWESPKVKNKGSVASSPDPKTVNISGDGAKGQETIEGKLRFAYTINLNLPATTEIEVFNAIFRSLRENLLRD